MQYPRFFVLPVNRSDDTILITEGENVHLSAVLRLKPGDRVDICLNDGNVYECELLEVGKKESLAKIKNIVVTPERENKIALFMALTKSERMDIAIEKVTELGIGAIIPFESKFCTAKDKGNKHERLSRIALSASKQSGRVRLPEISETLAFDKMLENLKSYSQIIVAYEHSTASAKEVLSALENTLDTAIIIGSEGGFDETEIASLENVGAKVISLGDNILRAETAAVALTSALLYQFDTWKKGK